MLKRTFSIAEFLWDLWCCVSVVGIWPRFIEPNLLDTKNLTLSLTTLPTSLDGLRIFYFSDLHMNRQLSNRLLNKVIHQAKTFKPDLIIFGGDFLCFSQMDERERLSRFLRAFDAPGGCYAILGNHDYDSFVSINTSGDYDVISSNSSSLKRALGRLFLSPIVTGVVTTKAQKVGLNEELIAFLRDTPFNLLHNENREISIRGSSLNLCGLGEYMLGQCKPETAFKQNNPLAPTLILAHNPDSISKLRSYPGEVILSGHTHGGQVNLPWLWRKFTLMENIQLKKGLVNLPSSTAVSWLSEKWIYVTRGVGSVLPFRWFAKPEVVLLTLRAKE
jgi:predicted MPP superfamily phosphohydrolase